MKINISKYPVPYIEALDIMKEVYIHKLKNSFDPAESFAWFLEHLPVYTLGSSTKMEDFLGTPSALDIPMIQTGRGGKITYHGPGQLVGYCFVNMKVFGMDIRKYIKTLEYWIISVLRHLNIEGFIAENRVGVWVINPVSQKEEKIAAIGVRVTQGITSHGFCMNRAVNLDAYKHIIPCGLSDFGVTSLHQLGIQISFDELISLFLQTNPFASVSDHFA